jgi:hypothetical protein
MEQPMAVLMSAPMLPGVRLRVVMVSVGLIFTLRMVVVMMFLLSPGTTCFFAFRREKSIATGSAAVQGRGIPQGSEASEDMPRKPETQTRKEATMTGRNGQKAPQDSAAQRLRFGRMQGGRAAVPWVVLGGGV